MWRTARGNCDSSPLNCPKCGGRLRLDSSFNSPTWCRQCNEPLKTVVLCSEVACEFHARRCLACIFKEEEKNIKPPTDFSIIIQRVLQYKKWIFVMLFSALFFAIFFNGNGSVEPSEDMNVALIKKLKKDFPSQKNETWFHLLSVLERKIPSVKAITFLYRKDEKTPNCLTNAVVSLYTTNSKIKMEEITFSVIGSETKDYGFLLEHYHAVVKKFGVLVTDLSKVSGNVARIFHSLCDEVSSDIKPSLFIFTLKYDKNIANMNPLERAVSILKEAWRTLPQNEISPLLSRIIKNVVDVVPELKINC